jgi:hypothetical protein
MSLVIPTNFQHILRVMNTNIDGKRTVMFAMTAIKGIGRRYANLVLKKVMPDVLFPVLINFSIPVLSGYSQNFLCKFVKIFVTLGLYILSFLRLKVLF